MLIEGQNFSKDTRPLSATLNALSTTKSALLCQLPSEKLQRESPPLVPLVPSTGVKIEPLCYLRKVLFLALSYFPVIEDQSLSYRHSLRKTTTSMTHRLNRDSLPEVHEIHRLYDARATINRLKRQQHRTETKRSVAECRATAKWSRPLAITLTLIPTCSTYYTSTYGFPKEARATMGCVKDSSGLHRA